MYRSLEWTFAKSRKGLGIGRGYDNELRTCVLARRSALEMILASVMHSWIGVLLKFML
jgi:hypothetical protein